MKSIPVDKFEFYYKFICELTNKMSKLGNNIYVCIMSTVSFCLHGEEASESFG